MKPNEMKVDLKGILFTGIIVLMLISLVIPGITGSWVREANSTAFTYAPHYSKLTSLSSSMSIYLLYILLIVCIWSNQKKGKTLLIVYLCSLVFIVWGLFAFYEANLQEVLLDDVSINLILIPLFYILGYEKAIFESAKRLIPFIVVLMVGLIFWSSLSFVFQYGLSTETRTSPSKEMFAVAISAYWCYSLGMSESKKYHRSFKYILGICLLICAFLIRSRSWIIQCILLLYAMLAFSAGKNALLRKIVAAFTVVLVFLLIILLLPNVTGALFDRIGQDTRSGQYDTFFSQVDATSLLWGQGRNAGYSFLGITNYRYFDNQFIYIMFHYGIVPVLCLLGVIAGLFRKINKDRFTIEEQAYIVGCRLMSFFFLTALGGLSVYFKFGWNLGTLFVLVFIGRGVAMMSEARERKRDTELRPRSSVIKGAVYDGSRLKMIENNS
ncbi:hypothetical protein [Paenibacillus sp. BC26]|uniref:hypothetical protein n=1 Tax=Paenibacillus sp. BC26 TaxID=1881032 RepID=UPI0008E783AE|nr:hypothetical protein [Paenibacillus sp. BC26]SFT02995.1 hypothetical protein SAMN05428962_3827 [Paenibacillus sp. BC26]